ncbi:MAG: hypothetical protein KF716_15015 [Anaerolineae bacterium]|nr:hypothetical protein [Anaerolineae bacterium]
MKQQVKVQHWIADHYDGFTLTGQITWMIAEECQVARSTVYRAINSLREIGAVNEKRVYIGRQFIKPEEIARYAIDGTILMTETKAKQIANDLFAVKSAVWAGVRWGVIKRNFQRHESFYGTLLRMAA